MTSLLQPPGSRVRSSSIPTLVALQEEIHFSPPKLAINGSGTPSDARKYSDSNLPSATAYTNLSASQKPEKASRRSSLGLGLLGGKNVSNKTDKSGKRRSSIAVVFLGRRNSKVCKKIKIKTDIRSSDDLFCYKKLTRTFRNSTVERAGNGEGWKVSEIFGIRHGKWSASDYNYHNARSRNIDAG